MHMARKLLAGLSKPPRQSGCTRHTKRCDFWNWGPGSLRPACCTDHMKELAFFTEDLLSRHRITHWLDYGSLLGAVREQAFIPWDEDVDFGILARDVDAVRALRPEITRAGFHLATSEPPVIRFTYSAVNMQPLDLFVWQESNGLLRTEAGSEYDWPGMYNRTAFPPSYLDKLDTVRLYGKAFPAPSPVHEFLVHHRYGPDYLVPTRFWVEGVPDIGPEELTPLVKNLLQQVDQARRRLAELTRRSRLSRFEAWRNWTDAGLPVVPADRFVKEARTQTGSGEPGPVFDQLLTELARVNQAIEDARRPPPRRWITRTRRRVTRAAALIRPRGDGG